MNPFDKFYLYVGELGKKLAPGIFCNPVNQYFLMIVSYMALGLTIVALITLPFSRIKDPAKRIKLVAITATLFVNTLVIFLLFQHPGPIRANEIVGSIILNLLFFGIWNLPKSFKKDLAKDNLYRDQDLRLKNQSGNKWLFQNCPNCGLRTIAKLNAAKTPQTCGECGMRYETRDSWVIRGVLSTFSFLVILTILYINVLRRRNPWLSVLFFILGLLPLSVYQNRTRKLVKVP